MEVKKLNHVLQLVRDTLENEKISAEEQLQLNKICELEDKFVKDFSKDKWREYFDLDIEKGQLVSLYALSNKSVWSTTDNDGIRLIANPKSLFISF